MIKIKITPKELDRLEEDGLSEQQISDKLNCSRMGLYKYRVRINCPQKIRQGKGLSKYTAEEQRRIANKFQSLYRLRMEDQYGDADRGRNRRKQHEIMINALGREPKSNECLHHIDNNPSNNAHNNLVICTRQYHRSIFHTDAAQSKINNYQYTI